MLKTPASLLALRCKRRLRLRASNLRVNLEAPGRGYGFQTALAGGVISTPPANTASQRLQTASALVLCLSRSDVCRACQPRRARTCSLLSQRRVCSSRTVERRGSLCASPEHPANESRREPPVAPALPSLNFGTRMAGAHIFTITACPRLAPLHLNQLVNCACPPAELRHSACSTPTFLLFFCCCGEDAPTLHRDPADNGIPDVMQGCLLRRSHAPFSRPV